MERRLSVAESRAHWDGDDGWVCDTCGDCNEETLVMYSTGRVTRATIATGDKIVCLCDVCAARIPHGRMWDQ